MFRTGKPLLKDQSSSDEGRPRALSTHVPWHRDHGQRHHGEQHGVERQPEPSDQRLGIFLDDRRRGGKPFSEIGPSQDQSRSRPRWRRAGR